GDRVPGRLGHELGPPARLEHGHAVAKGPVLRQRPPGLTHEPHRGVRHRLAAAGAHEHGAGRPGLGRRDHAADAATVSSRDVASRPAALSSSHVDTATSSSSVLPDRAPPPPAFVDADMTATTYTPPAAMSTTPPR